MSVRTHGVDLSQGRFRLGEWLVEPQLNRLSSDNESTQIELKMMDVLVCLAEHAGELVTRRQLIDTVWATEYITDKTLTRAVAELRRTLGDDATAPRFIETIHRKGYRLIEPVELEELPSVVRFTARAARADDDRNPYPGLSAFSEQESDFFFGRESDVRSLWRRITTRKLLAVIGPSGIGKTSLLHAGLIPEAPPEWGALVMEPGESVFKSLGRVLVPVFRDDEQATRELFDMDSVDRAVAMVCRWRAQHDRALLVVDQFEELFTLNPAPSQLSFAEVVGRLARDGDVHVLLAMRDDFLVRCHALSPLRPIFEELTVVDRPNRAALRRALEEPAARFGYTFEDGLVTEILDGVDAVRSPLPMLAFTAARLWELRDRGQRRITRQTYRDIGGLAGALARHAEVTLGAVGGDRVAIVRELFRNLVTAEGTRAVRSVDELLSVFPGEQRSTAAEVLERLVTARLLTTYEEREPSGGSAHRVEVAHESLLDTWPRLVGWRTQDADAARLRDELRQAARTWDEHGRPADLLWAGATYREFATWRERYPGRLSETERAFADAVTWHTARRRRRRRAVVSGTLVVLLGLLAVVGGLWQRSRQEANRAEAANLLALGRLQLDEHPSAAVAYAIAGLQLADNPEIRRLALEALWMGPTELRLPASSWYSLEFSPDGRWLATADQESGAKLWPADGGPPTVLDAAGSPLEIRFSPAGDLVAANTSGERREVKIWSLPGGDLVRSLRFDAPGTTLYHVFSRDGRRLITSTVLLGRESSRQVVRSWPVDGGDPEVIARLATDPSANYVFPDLHPTGESFSWSDGRVVRIAMFLRSKIDTTSIRSLEHERPVAVHVFDPSGRTMATLDDADTVRIWSLDAEPPQVTRTFDVEQGTYFVALLFDHSGSRLAGPGGVIWDLGGPPDAGPLRLRRPGPFRFGVTFGPNDVVVATSVDMSVSMWPLTRAYPVVLAGHESSASPRAFSPDGSRLVSTSRDRSVRIWPLADLDGERCRVLDRVEGAFKTASSVAVAPNGAFVVVGYAMGQVKVLPLDGSPARQLHPFIDNVDAIAVDPSSRFVAVGSGGFFPEDGHVHVWDLETDEVRVLDAGDGVSIGHLEFTKGGDLWVWSAPVLRCWDLTGEVPRIVEEVDLSRPGVETEGLCDLDADRRRALLWQEDRIWLQDLDTDDAWEVEGRGGHGEWCSLDPTGTIALLGDVPGIIRVARIGGGPAHWLPGRFGGDIVVSPDGRWVASGGEGNTIWLWPMPDLDSPPLHTLPRDQLIAKLESLTNLRAVRDDDSPTGWTLEVGPFPGWETVPTW